MVSQNPTSAFVTGAGFVAAMRSRLCWQISLTMMLAIVVVAVTMMPQLNQVVGRTVVVIAVAALFVGALSQVLLGRVLMRPLARLQAHLRAVEQTPDAAERYLLPAPRYGEFAGTVDAFNGLLRQVSEPARGTAASGERRLRDFSATATDFFWETGPDLRLSYVSARFAEITGIEAATALNEPLASIDAGGEGSPAARDRLTAETNAGHAFRGVVVACRGDSGNVVYVSLNGRPVVDGQGRFRGYRGSGAEVAALWQARQVLMANSNQAERVGRAPALDKARGDGLAIDHAADADAPVAIRRRA
jgi:PAS domain S-box-containing protein